MLLHAYLSLHEKEDIKGRFRKLRKKRYYVCIYIRNLAEISVDKFYCRFPVKKISSSDKFQSILLKALPIDNACSARNNKLPRREKRSSDPRDWTSANTLKLSINFYSIFVANVSMLILYMKQYILHVQILVTCFLLKSLVILYIKSFNIFLVIPLF